MGSFNYMLSRLLSIGNHIVSLIKCEHPELEMNQTRFLTFDGHWIWNWTNGIYYIPTYASKGSESPINAILHGTGTLQRDYPNGIHCKKIVSEFRKSKLSLNEFINMTTLEKIYIKDVDHIELLDEETFETIYLK